MAKQKGLCGGWVGQLRHSTALAAIATAAAAAAWVKLLIKLSIEIIAAS